MEVRRVRQPASRDWRPGKVILTQFDFLLDFATDDARIAGAAEFAGIQDSKTSGVVSLTRTRSRKIR